MKINNHLIIFCLIYLWPCSNILAQSANCTNLDFSLGNFTNWVGHTWRYSELIPSINSNPVAGIVSRRQTIMSDTSAYDANTGYALKKIPEGYLYSARLGDEIISSDGNPRCWNQSLRYTMTIDSSNALLIFRFALVLQYASDHNQTNEPRFKLTLYDNSGNTLPDCSNYDVYSSNKNVKGFQAYTPSGFKDPVMWRDWTTVGADLSKYIGQSITIEFTSRDCSQRYHFGYAYFVAGCKPLVIGVKYCTADSVAVLEAPEGFESYVWRDNNGNVLDTVQTLKLTVPEEKAIYACTMTSATGCVVTLKSSVAKYTPKAGFSDFMLDCKSNTVQFTNLSTTNRGSLAYLWSFEDGGTSASTDPAYTFSTSGMHTVTLIVSDEPSTCKDTLTKQVESFSPPLVGITGDTTYCPNLTTYLLAYGAWDYTWNTGSKADSIKVGAPGGTFWLIGRSSTGCISDTIYKTVTEKPDWLFVTRGDTVICGNESALLTASGDALSYLWNTGILNDSIIVSEGGTYVITGTNKRGCKKSTIFNVKKYPLPKADFTISPSSIDRRHDMVKGNISVESGVQYAWEMGDGQTETGSTIQHTYSVSNSVLYYKVKVVATAENTCSDSSYRYIDVVPFVPNVFSPNGDEINDVFMPGYEMEIVDRNGMQIYKGNLGWDGKHNGRNTDPDTYFYLIYYNDSKGDTHTRKGYVVLVR